MSFVGFSDVHAFRWWGSGLTTIGLPVRDIALACSAFLLRRPGWPAAGTGALAAPRTPCQATHLTHLIERGSIAPPRRDG